MKQPQSKLPKFGDWLLRILARYDVNPHLRGDFDEEFCLIYETKGFVRAWLWYWTHLLRSLPVFIKDILYWRFVMINNYFKLAIRNVKRHKGYALMNILGLAVGMACCILILLYVQYELSYDRYHHHADHTYRILLSREGFIDQPFAGSPPRLAPALKDSCPEVIRATRVKNEVTSVRYKTRFFRDAIPCRRQKPVLLPPYTGRISVRDLR